MNNFEREIRLYQTADGRVPFSDWFESLRDDKTKQRIDARLARVRLGNLGDCKGVGGGIFELRVDFGPGFRIYFAQQGTEIIILLCGGDKSTQSRDIKRAKEYWARFKRL